jgi:general secretion pathway protein G
MQEICSRLARGFGLLELMIALVVAGLLAALAVPAYSEYIQRARVARAIADIGSLHIKIEEYQIKNGHQLPANLGDLTLDIGLDPWNQPYEYLNIQAAGPGNGGLRKDGQLNPLNTDYDLYSIGADGVTAGPLSAKASRDDIVRANNGSYIGLGEDY